MLVVHAVSDLLQVPAVYAMYGGRGSRRYVAYVGIANSLKSRVVQHLVRRDSSVTTGTSAVQLNPAYVTELQWWVHPRLAEQYAREAAEMVAFDVLDPALRSRGAPQQKARELHADEEFQQTMHSLFESKPAGRLVLVAMEDVLDRILKLEGRVSVIEQRLDLGGTH